MISVAVGAGTARHSSLRAQNPCSARCSPRLEMITESFCFFTDIIHRESGITQTDGFYANQFTQKGSERQYVYHMVS